MNLFYGFSELAQTFLCRQKAIFWLILNKRERKSRKSSLLIIFFYVKRTELNEKSPYNVQIKLLMGTRPNEILGGV